MQRTPYCAKADVANMLRRSGFRRPEVCQHDVTMVKNTIKRNGDCMVCGDNLDVIRVKEVPSYVKYVCVE